MEIQYNVMQINSIGAFSGIHGRKTADRMQVYFLRCIGCGGSYIKDIEDADRQLGGDSGCVYRRLTSLPAIADSGLIAFYSDEYGKLSDGRSDISLKNCGGSAVGEAVSSACRKICGLNKKCNPNYNPTIEKNLIVSLLYWADTFLAEMLGNISLKHCKLIYSGKTGYREYSFCCLAAFCGIDVLILLPSGDASLPDALLECSASFSAGEPAKVNIPEFRSSTPAAKPAPARPPKPKPSEAQRPKPPVTEHRVPFRAEAAAPARGAPVTAAAPRSSSSAARTPQAERKELNYEELAALASSVVMIAAQDASGDIISTGSGIIISRDGYILTNCHVTSGGVSFAVRFENDDNVYTTNEIIKYHSLLDLALLRINHSAAPLKVYSQKKELLRGQKVIAIGSPLGMFNSVSDGIISGFRRINGTDMIQFTAPISPGSSGGAVLNTCGEIIGISTAGLAGGQNINLAVSYKEIGAFISGFVH